MSNASSASWAADGHNPWLVAFVVSIATFMEVLDISIANVALRHIAGSMAASYDHATWILTSYLVANADGSADQRVGSPRPWVANASI